MDGKKEAKDLIVEVDVELRIMGVKVNNMLFKTTKYEERRLLEKLMDSIKRSRDDIRRNVI